LFLHLMEKHGDYTQEPKLKLFIKKKFKHKNIKFMKKTPRRITGEDIIKFTSLSKLLVNNTGSIRHDNIPEKYKKDVDELIKIVNQWIQKKQKKQ